MKKIVNWMVMALMAVALLGNTGCFITMYQVKKFNQDQDDRALQHMLRTKAKADQDGVEVNASVDPRELPQFAKGYAAAWKNEPGKMAVAAGGDTLWMSLVGWLVRESTKSGGDSSSGGINISAGGDVSGDITQINGDGNSVRQNTTQSEFAE
jgi:hypothetical protein